ncbi:methyl-accepting chemotaxis protein, partial [Acinetobacter baumannii]
DDTLWQVGAGVVIALGAIARMWMVARGIARPVRLCVGFAEGIARGDFNQTLDIRQADELGTLSQALRTMLEDLKRMIAQRA